MTGFFVIEKSQAEVGLKITKIQFTGGVGKSNEDFIEITNTTEKEINLKGYRLAKQTSSGKKYNIVSFSSADSIAPGKTYFWASSKIDNFPKSIGANISRKATISENNGIAIIFGDLKNGTIIDSVNWKEEGGEEENGGEEKLKDYSDKIRINEIKSETSIAEFVEIINNSGNDLDFNNWCIKDKVKYNKTNWSCKKPTKVEQTGKFYVFYGSFSLNNDSGGDAVYLYDKNKNLIDSVSYKNAKNNYVYAFDGSTWRWTSQPTPGKINQFDKILTGKIRKDKNTYANIYANFYVKADKDVKKFTWDFGDGHKSYLKNTRHKYIKKGNYNASLKITGQGEEHTYNFTVKVKKYKAPKVRIVSFSPNPQGSDIKNEWLEIENKSKKKVNLKNWSIATGWNNLYNHPLRKDFKIKPKKSKKLTRDICAFILANTKDKIELRSPDGKTAQKIKYDHGKKSIEENEIYKKQAGGKWIWLAPFNYSKKIEIKIPLVLGKANQKTEEKIISETTFIGKYSADPAWQNKKRYRTQLFSHNLPFKFPLSLLDSSILDTQKVISNGNYYSFNSVEPEKYWATVLLKKLELKINSRLNQLLLKI